VKSAQRDGRGDGLRFPRRFVESRQDLDSAPHSPPRPLIGRLAAPDESVLEIKSRSETVTVLHQSVTVEGLRLLPLVEVRVRQQDCLQALERCIVPLSTQLPAPGHEKKHTLFFINQSGSANQRGCRGEGSSCHLACNLKINNEV